MEVRVDHHVLERADLTQREVLHVDLVREVALSRCREVRASRPSRLAARRGERRRAVGVGVARDGDRERVAFVQIVWLLGDCAREEWG